MFVIDNLDRIDPSEALGIWSVVVGLVADEAHRVDKEKEPLVIVPLDKKALSDLVKAQHGASFDTEQLIEKSFDITFEVPPPVLTNWRAYFADQYEKCGLWEKTQQSTFERYWTIRNFEHYIGNDKITPRKINRFLNRVVSLSQQQLDSPAPKIASYYLAHEKTIKEDCLGFLRSAIPGFDDGTTWQLRIAAIAFGASEADAAQVLLGDELSDALSDRNRSAFQGIQTVPGFIDVARNFVEDPLIGENGKVDAAPLTALAAFCGQSEPKIDDAVLWSRLWAAWRAAEISGVDKLLASAMSAFIETGSNRTAADISLLMDRTVEQIRAARDIDSQKDFVRLGGRISDLGGEALEIDLGTDAPLLLSIIGSAEEGSPLVRHLRFKGSFEDLASHVLERLRGKLAILAASEFKLVEQRIDRTQVDDDKDAFFESVGNGLREAISDEESPDQTLIYGAQMLASRQDKAMRYSTIIGDLATAGTFSPIIKRALENEADAVVSAITALQLSALKMPSPEEINSLRVWLEKRENADLLLASLRQMNGGSFLPTLRNLEAAGNTVDEILRPLLVRAIQKGSIGARAHADWLLTIFDKAAGWLNDSELKAYAKLISTWNNFPDELMKIPVGKFTSYITKVPNEVARSFLQRRLKALDAKGLSRTILIGDELWQSYSKLNPDIGSELPTKSILFEALHLVLSGSSGALGARSAARAMKVADLLNEGAKKQLIKSVVTTAVEKGNDDVVVTLSGMDRFKSYIGRPKVTASILEAMFEQFRRVRDGQKFVERHAEALKQISDPAKKVIAKSLSKSARSRDAKTADWARFVIDKSGLKE